MNKKPMEIIRVTAEKDTVMGQGVARVDGKVVFIRGMLAGENGLIRVIKQDKKYDLAEIVSLDICAPDRIKPKCPYAALCGGCSLSHVSEAHEKKLKRERVLECLQKLGHVENAEALVKETVSGEREAYRNKAELLYRDGSFGYTDIHGDFLPVTECLLLPKEVNTLLSEVKKQDPPGLKGAVIRINRQKEMMLVLTFTEKVLKLDTEKLTAKGMVSLYTLKPAPRQTHALDGELTHLWGKERLDTDIAGLKFHLLPKSFFQVNREMAEKLYLRGVALADLADGQSAVDAYCGVGAIGMLASQKARNVFGVELIPDAVQDAILASKENGIEHISFMAGKCEEMLPKHPSLKKADVIFLDPPRKGCDRRMLEAVVSVGIPKIVYISCDPATLARDIAYLQENGYDLKTAEPYNLFSNTSHVETIVVMSKN